MPDRIFKKAKMVALTPEEKTAGREALYAYMKDNPMSVSRFQSPYFSWFYQKKYIPAALVVALCFAAGTSFAAQGALPGDILYPIKINVNEKVQSILAISPQAQAQVETEHANERLVEAEKLSAQGKIDASSTVAIDIKNRFTATVDAVAEHVIALTSSKNEKDVETAIQINSDFQRVISNHKKILTQLSLAAEFGLDATTTNATTTPHITPEEMNRPSTPQHNILRIDIDKPAGMINNTITASTTAGPTGIYIPWQPREVNKGTTSPSADTTGSENTNTNESVQVQTHTTVTVPVTVPVTLPSVPPTVPQVLHTL